MKDKDSFAQTQYLSMYSRGLLYCLIMGGLLTPLYGWIALIIVLLISFVLPFPAMYATGRIAVFFVFLYSGGSGTHTLHDQLAGEAQKIRILKREKNFTGALEQAAAVLTRSPEHPEALLLKIQSLCEGFGKYSAANACLNKIIAQEEPAPDAKLLEWAVSLRGEILLRIRKWAEKYG
ncbi:MAG: tetratricopeptide repeat protein [Candidatus Electrothrix sp. YB6]